MLGILPAGERPIARIARHHLKIGDGVFPGILGVDAFAFGEAEAAAGHGCGLVGEATDVDRNTSDRRIVFHIMWEPVDREIRVGLMIYSLQEIEGKKPR